MVATVLLWLLKIVFVHPIFVYVWMGFGGLFFFLLPLRPAALGFALTCAIFVYITSGASVEDLGWRSPAVWIFLGSVTIGSGIAYWLEGIISQSRERHTLIQELEATRADLAASERRAGILSERQRLAREIHDTVAQGFISIVMHLEAAEQALPTGQPVIERHISQAQKTARESLAQARRVVEDLRPAPLEEAALPEAIRQVVAKWERRGKETAVFTVTGEERPLSPQIEDALLRAVQEALANVRKHAQATHVALTLSFIGDLVLLDVQDDGVGLAASNRSDGGFGLIAMRQRVTRLGGSVTLESEPDSGTTLAIQIPIP
ncbi:MAG: sensor histidine kinase [Chloroflexota bacterium]